jgi:hypothetical protein
LNCIFIFSIIPFIFLYASPLLCAFDTITLHHSYFPSLTNSHPDNPSVHHCHFIISLSHYTHTTTYVCRLLLFPSLLCLSNSSWQRFLCLFASFLFVNFSNTFTTSRILLSFTNLVFIGMRVCDGTNLLNFKNSNITNKHHAFNFLLFQFMLKSYKFYVEG